MTFLEFYNMHFIAVSILLFIGGLIILGLGVLIFKKLTSNGSNIKTPWFEIANESVKTPESEDMAKTRLLLKRQFEFVEHHMDGIYNMLMAIESEVIKGAMLSMFNDYKPSKTNMETCLIKATTQELRVKIENYVKSLLVINHIGTDKDKIKKYAMSHTSQIVAIFRKHNFQLYSELSHNICMDLKPFLHTAGIGDIEEWVENNFYTCLISLCELRYSDFQDK